MTNTAISKIEENKITREGIDYFVTMGLEVHAEMNTKTKMWCACKNEPLRKEPNVNICPICMAHPGTLPVPNKLAMQNVVKVGLAIESDIADFTEFDRKNYFYPDIPKGYQISQYKYPLVSGGHLAGVDITRIHLEEDTAKSTHDQDDNTLVDFNRAGVPLMELVTEAVIHDTETIVSFAKELQLLLKYLNVSDADMEKGQMRIEVNISVSKDKDKRNSRYVECKNINSFGAAKAAAEYEIDRMIELFEQSRENEIIKETRGWDENARITRSQRNKENAEDYRYFPDPDITKFYLKDNPDFDLGQIKATMPELPNERRARLIALDVKSDYIDLFINQRVFGDYFDEILKLTNDKKIIEIASNYIGSDLMGIMNTYKVAESEFSYFIIKPKYLIELAQMLISEEVSSRVAKDMLIIFFESYGILNKRIALKVNSKVDSDEEKMNFIFINSPRAIAEKYNLLQISNENELEVFVQTVISDEKNTKSILDYKSGKEQALMALVGQVIKSTGGRANPSVTKNIFVKLLN
jgi:aspartyl-tRNA(Asn)/glutamyl-tRNA(Gln) amidotransferase subunit B